MKAKFIKRPPAGFVSYLMVLTTATLLSLLSIHAYRRAMTSHKIESQVQLRVDYSEKEEAILRSIVAVVPNRAMLAMQPDSALQPAASALSWQSIFDQALVMGNSRTSIPADLEARLGLPLTARRSNTGDSNVVAEAAAVFSEIQPLSSASPALISVGAARDGSRRLGAGYPPLLNYEAGAAAANDLANDQLYPIISNTKEYGPLAGGAVDLLPGEAPGIPGISPGTDYRKLNRVPYPQVSFNYCTPGEFFVTKRNWWAFSLNVANQEAAATAMARVGRDFVLSIYEIPSQLAISSAAVTRLGSTTGAAGGEWTENRVKIDGGVSTGRPVLDAPLNAAGATRLASLAARSGVNVAPGAVVGNYTVGQDALGGRDIYQNTRGVVTLGDQTSLGEFYPISLSSDSGRCAFVPISVGTQYYDRFMQPDSAYDKYNPNPATNALSSTSWRDYSIGARQCAMQLDVTGVESSIAPIDLNTSAMTFSYIVNGTRIAAPAPIVVLGGGETKVYIRIREDGGNFDCGATPTGFAYGYAGNFVKMNDMVGIVNFNPVVFESSIPFTEVCSGYIECAFTPITSSGPAAATPQVVKVSPEKFPLMLAALGADPTSINHSLVVNVNYTGLGPTIPLAPTPAGGPTAIKNRYTLLLENCDNLTFFPRGFSLVTNMNLNISDHFNLVGYLPVNHPAGYTPFVTPSNPGGICLPATSLFAPSSKYGHAAIPVSTLTFGGQRNALPVNDAPAAVVPVNPLVSQNAAGGAPINAANLTMNLSKMRHPVEIPPVTMMNWLIVLEERRREYGQ